MKIWSSLLTVVALVLIAWLGVEVLQLTTLFGVALPYAAFALLVVGIIIRVVKWGKSPVPFSIPTTCGQQQSLPWIKQNKIENPSTTWGVIARMALAGGPGFSLVNADHCYQASALYYGSGSGGGAGYRSIGWVFADRGSGFISHRFIHCSGSDLSIFATRSNSAGKVYFSGSRLFPAVFTAGNSRQRDFDALLV